MKINYIVISFLIGSIPFAVLITYLFNRQSIQTMGDKNPGARNVVHSVGLLPGTLTLILDAGKGMFLLIMLQKVNFSTTQIMCYLFIGILGHAFSPFLLGKGGQGVAMLVGGMVWLFPFPALLSMVVFGLIRKRIKKFDVRYSVVLILFVGMVFWQYSILWIERLLIVGLFLFPLIKGFLFPSH
jgi:acyl-phosphate glycerol 3-phosphate acyltransferase